MLKRNILLGSLILCILLSGCKSKKNSNGQDAPVVLNEQSVTKFANDIVHSIVNNHPDSLNNAFDTVYLKQQISENSIVYSSFNMTAGKKYFNTGLMQGNLAAEAINNGGDFTFVKYYQKDKQHHVIFRIYDNFNVNFLDYIVDTVKGKLMIKDGFMFNTGTLLSKNLEYGMLYNLLLQTNPESDVKYLRQAQAMTEGNQNAKALQLLDANKEKLKQYPLFWQLYIANLYKTNPTNFIAKLDALKQDGLDERYLLLHKLLYNFNNGNVAETEATINQLIPYSGDDPIYLLFYGKANIYAHQYKKALECLKTADESMPLL